MIGIDQCPQPRDIAESTRGVDVVVGTVRNEDPGHLAFTRVRAQGVVVGPGAGRDGFMERCRSTLAVALDRELVVNADTVLDQQPGEIRIAAPRRPIHQRQVVRPTGVGLLGRYRRCVRRTGFEHRLERIGGAGPCGFVENVVRGPVDLQGYAPPEQQLDGRSAASHADGNGQQPGPDPVEEFGGFSKHLGHSRLVGLAVPTLWRLTECRNDERLFPVVQIQPRFVAQKPVAVEQAEGESVGHDPLGSLFLVSPRLRHCLSGSANRAPC